MLWDVIQTIAVLLFALALAWTYLLRTPWRIVRRGIARVVAVVWSRLRHFPLTPAQARMQRLSREVSNGVGERVAPLVSLSSGSGDRLRHLGSVTRDAGTSQQQQEMIRIRTLEGIEHLAEITTTPPRQGDKIPLLFGGGSWHLFEPGADGHLGVFGATNSGKGNLLQHLVLSALEMGPDNIHVVVIDAKGGLDYAFCDHLEHATLYADRGKKVEISRGCEAVAAEMERRIDLMRDVEARNWREYNDRVAPADRLPIYMVVYDEIGDYSSKHRDMVETVARMSRAEGFVVVVATQYPTTDVLSSQIQANISKRLVFRVESAEYSAVSLRRMSKLSPATYEPSLIPYEAPGIGVFRYDGGSEILGRAPHVTVAERDRRIAHLIDRWRKSVYAAETAADRFLPGVSVENVDISAFLQAETGGNAETETSPETLDDDRFDGLCQVLRGELSDRALLKVMRGKGSTKKNHDLIKAARQEVGVTRQDLV